VKPVDRLLFGTAGTPVSAMPRDSVTGIRRLHELGLDIMELEFVRGTFPGPDSAREIALVARENNIRLTAHGPYFINLNAEEPEKREASRKRILQTARSGSQCGAESITFHAGFFLGKDADTVFHHMCSELESIVQTIRQMNIELDVRPELTGRPTQFGSIDEIVRLSETVQGIKPCIDWSHLHARTGAYNTASEFQSILDLIHTRLGEHALRECHMHLSGIEYGTKGEKKHLNFHESDLNYYDLLRVLKDNGVCGFMVCESPSLEDDAIILKDYYGKV
jgi:deoxyribonuclease-4